MALPSVSLKQLTSFFRVYPTKAAEVVTELLTALSGVADSARFAHQYAGDAAANTVLAETAIAVIAKAGTMSAITLVFSGTVTANDTDYATITIRRRTGAGAGAATTIASMSTTITGGTGNITGFASVAATIAAGTLVAGDRVTLEVTKAGAGVQLPAFSVAMTETLA